MNSKIELQKHLESLITDRRRSRMQQVLSQRTRYITVCLEDLYQPHNASAVLRSCDCFGIQDVHVIENQNHFIDNREISLGTSQWLSINQYNKSENNTPEALSALKDRGYRIVATTPHTDDVDLEELDLSKGPVALVFGTELTGISDTVKEMADEYMKIPMYGFAESFNISVSAALCLHYLSHELRKSNLPWALSNEEYNEIYMEWLKGSVTNSDVVIREFLGRS